VQLWPTLKKILGHKSKLSQTGSIKHLRLRIEVSFRESIRRGEFVTKDDYDLSLLDNGDIRLRPLKFSSPSKQRSISN
ncbi:MAG: hypothetical protein M3Y72_11555, partial [Acidobacteriota bacterium]|nr:hypothetical protein [Acidobacteriota bacterium]